MLNNNDNNVNSSVHGSALGSIVNTNAGEPINVPTTLVWEINLRDLRTSQEALPTSFFQIYGGDGPTLIDSFFIEYKAPPALTGITITGDDTVQASTSEVTRTITLTAVQSPTDADSDIIWSVGSSETFDAGIEVTDIASINPVTGVLTGIGEGEVWVFAKGVGTNIYVSHKVTVTEFAHIPVTGIAINSVPADAETLMAGDGGANPGRTIAFSASPIPAVNDDIPLSTNPWVWILRSGEEHDSSFVDSAIATLSTSGPTRTLTGIFVGVPTDVWVFVSNTDFGIRASRKITVIPYEEQPWEVLWSWDREGIQSPDTILHTAATTISGTHWRLFNAGLANGTTLRPASVDPERFGLVMGNSQRLLIGTNSNTPTNNTAAGFHVGGQFNLGTTGTVRIRVHGTRIYNFFVAINLAATPANPNETNTVHGDRANFERQSPSSATSGMLVEFEIDLAALAAISEHSAAALATSFITLRTQNATAYDPDLNQQAIIHSISIERAP
jgi:hypothetical protein